MVLSMFCDSSVATLRARVEVKVDYLQELMLPKHRHSFHEEELVTTESSMLKFTQNPNASSCAGLYVKCSESYYDKKNVENILTKHEMNENTPQDLIFSPWNSDIYTDGVYRCSGILISSDWVVTARECCQNLR